MVNHERPNVTTINLGPEVDKLEIQVLRGANNDKIDELIHSWKSKLNKLKEDLNQIRSVMDDGHIITAGSMISCCLSCIDEFIENKDSYK